MESSYTIIKNKTEIGSRGGYKGRAEFPDRRSQPRGRERGSWTLLREETEGKITANSFYAFSGEKDVSKKRAENN